MRPRHFLPQLARPSHHHRLTLRLALHHRGLWAALTQAAAAAVVGSKFVATEVQLPQRWLLAPAMCLQAARMGVSGVFSRSTVRYQRLRGIAQSQQFRGVLRHLKELLPYLDTSIGGIAAALVQ